MSGIVHIMGIVNLTEDSFYAGSRTAAADALSRAQQMWASGATVVDLGACSTRPGAPQPSLEEEWARLEPALREMAGHCPSGNSVRFARQCPAISIDTYRSEIVRRAYEIIGPFMVNDISAGQLDPWMLETVGRLGLPYSIRGHAYAGHTGDHAAIYAVQGPSGGYQGLFPGLCLKGDRCRHCGLAAGPGLRFFQDPGAELGTAPAAGGTAGAGTPHPGGRIP